MTVDTDTLLATVERLEARLPEPVELDEEKALALEMLSDASEEARTYGSSNWQAGSCPPVVVNIVLAAASRGYMNPSGYTEEGADSARLKRGNDYVRGAEFTDSEIRKVKDAAKIRGVTYSTSTRSEHFQARSDAGPSGTFYASVGGGHGNWRAIPWLAWEELK